PNSLLAQFVRLSLAHEHAAHKSGIECKEVTQDVLVLPPKNCDLWGARRAGPNYKVSNAVMIRIHDGNADPARERWRVCKETIEQGLTAPTEHSHMRTATGSGTDDK